MKKHGLIKLNSGDININIGVEKSDELPDAVETNIEEKEASEELSDTIEKDNAQEEVIENLMAVKNHIQNHKLTPANLHLLNQCGVLATVLNIPLPSFEEEGEPGADIPGADDLANVNIDEVLDKLQAKIDAEMNTYLTGHTEGLMLTVIGTVVVLSWIKMAFKAFIRSWDGAVKRANGLKKQLEAAKPSLDGDIDEEKFGNARLRVPTYTSWKKHIQALIDGFKYMNSIDISVLEKGKPLAIDVNRLKPCGEAAGFYLSTVTDKKLFGGTGTTGFKFVKDKKSNVAESAGVISRSFKIGERGWKSSTLKSDLALAEEALALMSDKTAIVSKMEAILKHNKGDAKKKEDGTKLTTEEKATIYEAKTSAKAFVQALSFVSASLNNHAKYFVTVCGAVKAPKATADDGNKE